MLALDRWLSLSVNIDYRSLPYLGIMKYTTGASALNSTFLRSLQSSSPDSEVVDLLESCSILSTRTMPRPQFTGTELITSSERFYLLEST